MKKNLFYLLLYLYTNPLLPSLAPIEPTDTIFNFGGFYNKIITHISKLTEYSFSFYYQRLKSNGKHKPTLYIGL